MAASLLASWPAQSWRGPAHFLDVCLESNEDGFWGCSEGDGLSTELNVPLARESGGPVWVSVTATLESVCLFLQCLHQPGRQSMQIDTILAVPTAIAPTARGHSDNYYSPKIPKKRN